jgi:hypothetical protein
MLSAGTALAKPLRRQSNWGQSTLGVMTCQWSKAVIATDLVIAAVTYTGGTGTTVTPDNSHGTWTLITSGSSNNGTNIGVALYYRQNTSAIPSSTTETWSVSPVTAEAVLQLHEFSGVLASGAFDVGGVASGSASPALVSTSSPPVDAASEMSFVVYGVQSAFSTFSTPTPAFSNATATGTPPLSNSAAPTTASTKSRNSYALLTSSASANVSASMTQTGPSTNWAAAIATFKLSAIHWIGAGSYPVRPATPVAGVCYGFFDDDGCWSSSAGGANDVASPGATDVVIFDSGGTGDVTFNPLVSGTEAAYSIDVQSGYTGNLSVTDRVTDNPDLTTAARLQMAAGTFNLNAAQATVGTSVANGQDSFKMTGGTFNAGTGTLTITRNTTLNGTGTFNGGSGTETLNGALTVTAGAVTLGPSVVLTGNTLVGTSGSAATNGSLTLTSGTVTLPGTLIIDGASSSFSAGSTTLTIANATTIDFGGTFNAGSGTKTLTGRLVMGTAAGLTTGTFNLNTATVAFNSPSSVLIRGGSTFNGSAGGAPTFGANVIAGTFAVDIPNGTMNLSGATTTLSGAGDVRMSVGTLTMGPGSVTFPGNLTLTGTFDAGSASGVTVDGNLSLSAGTFHSKSATLDVKGTTSVTTSSVFDSVAANVTFESDVTTSGTASLDLSNTTPTMTAGALSVGSGSTLTLGAHGLSFPSTVGVNGTLTGGTGAVAFGGAVTNGAGILNLVNPTALTFSSGTLTVSGGTTTLGAQTVSLPALTVSGGAFQAGTSHLTVAGPYVSGGTTDFSSAASLAFPGGITLSGGSTTFGGQTVSVASLSMSGGTFNAGSSTTTVTAALAMTGGAFNANTSHLTLSNGAGIGNPGATSTFSANTSTITFSGPVTVGGSDGATRGVFHANDATISFEAATTAMAPDSLLLQGPANTVFDADTSPTLTFGKNAIAATNAVHLISGSMSLDTNTTSIFNPTGGAGNVTIGVGAALTIGTVATTFPATVTVAGTLNGGTGALTFSGPVSVSGTFAGSSGARVFSSTLDVSGAYTSSTGSHTFGGAASNSAGTLSLTTASSLTFNAGSSLSVSGGTTTLGSYSGATTTVPSLTVSGGTVNTGSGNTRLVVSGATNVSGGSATMTGNRPVTLSGPVTISGAGALTFGSVAESLGSTLSVSGGSFTAGTGAVTIASGVTVSGGTMTMGAGAESLQSTLDVTGGMFTAGSGAVTVSGAATISGGGSINGGNSSNLKFSNSLAIGNGTAGTFNASSAAVNFIGAVTLQNGGAFNGNTGSGTFSVAPTLTSGIFTVADTSSAGRWTFTQSTIFSSGVTLAFPTDRGELSLSPTKVLTLNGPVTSNVGSASLLPKIDCNGCTAVQGITVAFGATSTLNINGLELDNSVATGVSIASGATYTLLKRLKFQNNLGGAGSTHLLITLGTAVINVPGCNFDTTATTNVTLAGTAGQVRGARAIFEFQNTTANGLGAGNARDADGDKAPDPNPNNNFGENVAAPYYGSVIEWVNASPTDTTGAVVGFPLAAFDWNTFTFYGTYVAYKDTGGAGSADVLWLRNNDGSPAYSYSVPQTSGDIVGTPFFDTINEVTAGVDANGNGNQTDLDVRVAYIGTTTGHIIKLVDTGSALVQPTSGPWSTDFTSSSVATITSPLVEDRTNLYFGGTDGTADTRVFAVQVAGGGNEKTLQRNVGTVSAVTATPSWATSSGATYVFLGSTATAGHAFIYRINMTTGAVSASFSGATDSVNDAVMLVNNRAYAVTDGGALHVLDALNFNAGGFTNLAGFAYQTAAAKPIKFASWVDSQSSYAYFGDDGGNLYVVNASGAALTGFPFSISSSIKITSSPLYLGGSGVIAVGADDGYLYFIDRNNGSGPSLFKRFFVTGAGSVSSVSYNRNLSAYMVASSDGKLTLVNGADVVDPTSASQ